MIFDSSIWIRPSFRSFSYFKARSKILKASKKIETICFSKAFFGTQRTFTIFVFQIIFSVEITQSATGRLNLIKRRHWKQFEKWTNVENFPFAFIRTEFSNEKTDVTQISVFPSSSIQRTTDEHFFVEKFSVRFVFDRRNFFRFLKRKIRRFIIENWFHSSFFISFEIWNMENLVLSLILRTSLMHQRMDRKRCTT